MSGARIKANRSAPMKALPIPANLMPLQYGASITPSFSSAFSPPTRHISPEHAAGPIIYKGKRQSRCDAMALKSPFCLLVCLLDKFVFPFSLYLLATHCLPLYFLTRSRRGDIDFPVLAYLFTCI